MNREFFEGVSIIGREAYAILCAESYLGTVYPGRDWSPVVDTMWEVVGSDRLDEWAYSFCDVIPEFLFEAGSFEEANFRDMTRERYDVLTDLLRDADENVNAIFTALYDIVMDYAYTAIPGTGEDTLEDLESVCLCLESRGVPLPDERAVAFSSFGEQHGWGSPSTPASSGETASVDGSSGGVGSVPAARETPSVAIHLHVALRQPTWEAKASTAQDAWPT